MQITGSLVQKMDVKKISDSFSAQEFVIKVDGQYPQEVVLQASNKSIEWLYKCKVGDTLTIDFDIRGKRFTPATGNDKFFNTLSAYKIAVQGQTVNDKLNQLASTGNAEKEEGLSGLPF